MNNQFALGKEKAIWLRLEGRVNHLFLHLWTENGQIVHILPLICAVGHAEGELELELFQDLSTEKVLLYEHQVLQRLSIVNIWEFKVKF